MLLADTLLIFEHALNYLLDHFVVVSKKDILGISGYICEECISFQFQYDTDLWHGKTAKDDHRHSPIMLNKVNQLQDREAKANELRIHADRALIALTNSLFTPKIYLYVNPYMKLEDIPNFHGPIFKLDSITSEHWAWRVIVDKVDLSEIEIYNFIKDVGSTYALISNTSGPYSGNYVMLVTG